MSRGEWKRAGERMRLLPVLILPGAETLQSPDAPFVATQCKSVPLYSPMSGYSGSELEARVLSPCKCGKLAAGLHQQEKRAGIAFSSGSDFTRPRNGFRMGIFRLECQSSWMFVRFVLHYTNIVYSSPECATKSIHLQSKPF